MSPYPVSGAERPGQLSSWSPGRGERKAAERAVAEAGRARYTYRLRVSSAEQAARYGSDFGSLIPSQGHSRTDAYAAVRTGDEKLARRAWAKFYDSDGYTESSP